MKRKKKNTHEWFCTNFRIKGNIQELQKHCLPFTLFWEVVWRETWFCPCLGLFFCRHFVIAVNNFYSAGMFSGANTVQSSKVVSVFETIK